MPSHYDTHYEDDEQDWEPVVLKRPSQPVNAAASASKPTNVPEPMPLHRKIYLARSRNGYTAHEFAQKLHMKVRTYQKIEAGTVEPPPECIPKLRKYLDLRI